MTIVIGFEAESKLDLYEFGGMKVREKLKLWFSPLFLFSFLVGIASE